MHASSRFNLWATYFWFVEITFAVIGGTTEMWVYRQYMPDTQLSDAESFARALVTQLAIVGFGAAGIKAFTAIDNWGKWPVVILAFAFALGFAFVTFDLMLVSAVAFRNSEALGVADEYPIPTPWGTIPGQQVTLFIIAGVPFFQWAMSVFGPVITKERRQLSAAEIEEKGLAELAQIEMNARKRLAQAKGIAATFAAVKAGGKASDSLALSEGEAPPIGLPSPDSTPLPANVSRLRPSPKGPWIKEDMMAYIPLAYPGVTISESAALTAVKEAGNGTMKGTAYKCTINQAKAWARRHYGEPKAEGNEQQREVL